MPATGNATWSWENPLPQGEDLYSVSCPAAATCFAVGNARTIIATTNGGVSWAGQNMGVSLDRALIGISCPTVTTCFALTNGSWPGEAGVYGTTDGGKTWLPQTPQSFRSISCASTTTCVAVVVASVGVTTDGGAHWTVGPLGSNPAPMSAVSCAPATSDCVVVGSRGAVMTSTDSGAHWTAQTSGYSGDLNGVSCADALHCFAVGYNVVLSTTNGGTSWSTTLVAGNLTDASCSAPTTCSAVGVDGVILATTDGSSWSHQGSITRTLDSVSCLTGSSCVAVGAGGTIVGTTDAGSHWSYQSSSVVDPATSLTVVSCSSPRNCVAAGSASIVTTTDGSSWSAQSAGPGIFPYGLSCQSPSFCVGVGVNQSTNRGGIFRTINGTTWTEQDQGSAASALWGVSCPAPGTCFAVGSMGILATSDGGATWANQNPTPLYGISCPTSTICFSVGDGGTILATVDGHNWSRQATPLSTTAALRGVSCPSTIVCFAVDYQGEVAGTVNGGTTWAVQDVHGVFPTGITCPAPSSCLIWDSVDLVLVTSDGGASWSLESAGQYVYSVSCSLPTTCIGVGLHAAILLRAAASSVMAQPAFVAADGTSPSTVTVVIRDSLGEPLAGKTVGLTQSGGSAPAAITPASAISDSSGQAVFSITSSAPGTGTFAATDTTDATPVAQTTSVTFVASPFSAKTTAQYTLRNSDGATWRDIDPVNLSMRLTPSVDSMAVLSGNIDLWTADAGYNQDVGIAVSGGSALGTTYPIVPGQPEAWKESGGFAGTFSPNAAFVQAVIPMSAGSTYTVTLRWKTNKPAPGATIFAGAGPIGNDFSPSRLTAQLIPTSSSNWAYALDLGQHTLAGSDGSAWKDIDPSLSIRYTAAADGIAIIGGNADLWTVNAGYNQDIGISLVDVNALPCTGGLGLPCQPVAWKESGGFAGTYSPNAAFVQTTFAMSAGHTYQLTLQWKANKASANATIVVGAGPINSDFSPTLLSLQFVPAGTAVPQAMSTDQFALANSDGVAWQPLGPLGTLGLSLPAPAKNCQALISGNADLWTANAGFNQDLGIAVNGAIVAWKESGGFAGTFSPNAAYLQTVIPLTAGTASNVQLEWKTNRLATGATIYAGAGPIGSNYSPTQLTAQLIGC
jgi:photosystem II stability/assembly factor-like uncharacterized protein